MPETIVSVENVSKKFCRSLRQGMVYTLKDISSSTLGFASNSHQLRPGEFWAVNDVSFSVQRGECLGLLGTNGAGKSTLLKMLNGIIHPDKGYIRLRGRVGALIEVGAGFHPMLSGRENIYVSGTILGMSRREVARKFDAIVDFSGLDPAVLDGPVKTYSSGMYMRLGFSVAIHSEPDILLIDEALAVGDIAFVGKCRRQITQLLAGGTAVIFVTHRLYEAEAICKNALLLEAGKLVQHESVHAVIETYRRQVAQQQPSSDPVAQAENILPQPNSPRLDAICLTGAQGQETGTLHFGERCHLTITVQNMRADFDGELRLCLWRMDDYIVTAAAAVPWNILLEAPQPGRFTCHFPMLTMPGVYRLVVQLTGRGRFDYQDAHNTPEFEVVADPCTAPFVPRHNYARTVLDIRLDKEYK
jgi:ABC-type polysaccharide/polyol phosphate transport system ATPase subunit